MIETVLFDYVNTIAHLEPTREKILQQFARERSKKDIKAADATRAFKEVDEITPYSSVRINNEIKKHSFYQAYNKNLFDKLDLVCYNDYYRYYKNIKKEWILYEEALETICALKSKGIKVGIVSNFDKHLDMITKKLKIHDLMDIFVVSAQVGLEKPDINFYNYVKDTYSLDTTTTVYVGDSYNLAYNPSKQAGYNSYLIDRDNFYPSTLKKIANLSEIIKVVENASQSL